MFLLFIILIMKLFFGAVCIIFLALSASTYADDTGSGSMRGEARAEMKANMEEKRGELKEAINANKDEAAENRMNFREENKESFVEVIKSLSESEKEDFSELNKAFQSELEALKASISSSETVDAKEEIYAEILELKTEHYNDLTNLFSENEEALMLLEERKEVFLENQELREESKQLIKEYRGTRKETVAKYRTSFAKKLGNSLEYLSNERLEEISERITTLKVKFEDDEEISENKREALLGALYALEELIEEQVNSIED